MTEITKLNDDFPEALENFVLQWGDLGAAWGVNRSISQIHAYLYLADDPITAEDIANSLEMARSNVSNSLKELLAWNLIYRVPVKGDRRDHFRAETDVWEIAARIAAGRKAREIDPALMALRNSLEMTQGDDRVSLEKQEKLKAMLEFTESVDCWYGQMLSLPQPKRAMLLKLGAKIVSLLPRGKD